MSKGYRPIERRVLSLAAAGHDVAEIGRRFRRSPDHIRRVIELAGLPGRRPHTSDRDGLRAIERRVLRWREAGLDHAEIGRRFKRSAGHIRRIEGMALYKRGVRLLSDGAP